MDNLVRMGLREEVGDQEPSPGTRDALLAAAARNKSSRSALGPEMPALARGLCEANAEEHQEMESHGPKLAARLGDSQWLLMIAPLYAIR